MTMYDHSTWEAAASFPAIAHRRNSTVLMDDSLMTTKQPLHWQVGAILKDLSGDWQFVRTLQNTETYESIGSMYGVAKFSAEGESQAVCDEQGILTLANGQHIQSSALYYFHEVDGDIEIYFDPLRSRLFHRLQLQSRNRFFAESTHYCVADQYHSYYEFLSDGSFTITHNVKGPRKSYISHTHYKRGTPAS